MQGCVVLVLAILSCKWSQIDDMDCLVFAFRSIIQEGVNRQYCSMPRYVPPLLQSLSLHTSNPLIIGDIASRRDAGTSGELPPSGSLASICSLC
ncbi:hypothetical protein F5050DRAFT_1776622 [Lentinula boryana]|uniref:Secreted protein n=1 Tax=Lentinula boryana TaxID=40481 RepID=A0ABQ8Q6Q8_9AGAR|nr:hypothetical protein F5050DRAFT_1776622 [Lentinula boryana]